MLFTKKNPPKGYYVYFYIRKDGTPYYVGKGKGTRAWDSTAHTTKPWINQNNIVFVEWGLSDMWAQILERYFIRWFGRKDKGTGILRNRTDGGDGASGNIPWNKGKTKSNNQKLANMAKKRKIHGNPHQIGSKHTKERVDKIKQALTDRSMEQHQITKMKTAKTGKTWEEIYGIEGAQLKRLERAKKRGVARNKPKTIHTPYGVFSSVYQTTTNCVISAYTVRKRCRSPKPEWADWYYMS